MFFRNRKVQSQVLLYRQIGLILRSGQSLTEALKAPAGFPFKWMNVRLKSLCEKLDAGTEPAEAVAAFPELFPDFPVAFLRKEIPAKELGKIFYELADQIEKVHDMKRRMMRAFAYPLTIGAIGFSIFIFLMIFVIPQFQYMFESFGGSLPAFTRMILAMGEFTQEAFFPGLILFLALVIILYKKPDWRFTFGSMLPGCGSVMRMVSVYMLSRQISSFLATGISLEESIDQSVTNLQHFPYARKLKELSVNEKVSLLQFQQHLEVNRYFPRILVQMVGIGVQADDLSTALNEFSGFYEKEIDSAYFRLLLTTELLTLLFIAGLIGTTVIGMYLPIFQLAGTV